MAPDYKLTPKMDFGPAKVRVTDQSRIESALEALINIASGFAVSWGMWMFVVAPLFDIDAPVGEAFTITALFTITSLLRSYFWRRFFANNIHKKVHQWLK